MSCNGNNAVNYCNVTSYNLNTNCSILQAVDTNAFCNTKSASNEWKGTLYPINAAANDVNCTRSSYTANDLDCCFQDYVANDESACFSPSGLNTCNPNSRSVTCSLPVNGKSCADRVLEYCSGGDLPAGDTSWFDRWRNPITGKILERDPNNPKIGGCAYALQRQLFNNPNPAACNTKLINPITPSISLTSQCNRLDSSYPVSASGSQWGTQLFNAMFTRYLQDGYTIGAQPGTKGYNTFEEFLRKELCCAYPFLCSSSLNSICSTVKKEELSYNPSLASWCGCHLSSEEYRKYTDLFGISQECTPLCNREGVIPMSSGSSKKIRCEQNVCLIDDLTLSIANSTVSSGININQVCGSCGDNASCSCILENNTIDVVNTVLQGSITVQTMCGSTTCTFPSPFTSGPRQIPISCTDTENDPLYQYLLEVTRMQTASQYFSYLIVFGIICIFILIILLCIYLRSRR